MTEKIALAVDDASANREFLERLLGGAHFKVLSAGTGYGALKAAAEISDLTLAMVDMKLPDMTGLDLVRQLRERFPNAYLVIATMYDERSVMEDSFAAGCNVFLVKPHGFMELFQRLMTTDIQTMCAGPQLVIDQYGPRNFKAATQSVPKLKTTTQETIKSG